VHPRLILPWAAVTALGALLATACSGDASCGDGTALVDGRCVPGALTCGAGTRPNADGACVPEDDTTEPGDASGGDASDASDGADGSRPPSAWTCDAAAWGDGAACDCACGALDPDCLQLVLPVVGCADGGRCGAHGACIAGPPPGWACPDWRYGDGAVCDCDCGAGDPDCGSAELPVQGCVGVSRCSLDGACLPCAPSCDDKACGSDGCGGSCGACLDPTLPYCAAGACVGACVPDCAPGHGCGPDGCGGSCGGCEAGATCVQGRCHALGPAQSCVDRCGEALGPDATGFCSCAAGCVPGVDCCADLEAACGCVATCLTHDGAVAECGGDGCGGSCGTCPGGTSCAGGACVDVPCDPDPCGDHGVCDPADETCACATGYAGAVCDACAEGYAGFPDCAVDACATQICSGHGTCRPSDGGCDCDAGFTGALCHDCVDPDALWPACGG